MKIGVIHAEPSRRGAHFAPAAEQDKTNPPHQPSAPAASEATPDENTGGRKKIAAIVVGAVALVYLGGVILWSNVFMPNTKVNGVDVSFKSPASLASESESHLKDYTLNVDGGDVSLVITQPDVNLAIDYDSYAAEAMSKVVPWTWPVVIFTGSDVKIEAPISYDDDKLTTLVKGMVDKHNATATPSTDATASFNAETGKFELVKESIGTVWDEGVVKRLVTEALSSDARQLQLADNAVAHPSVSSTDARLAQAISQANDYLMATQSLVANNAEVYSVGAADISQWVKFGSDLSVTVDAAAITGWANDVLAPKLDTIGTTRTYTRSDGKQITVEGGTYGWSVDGEALGKTLAQNIQASRASTVEVPWLETAAVWLPGGAEWGNRYIDCDLSEQYARLYDESGNVIWESSFVSGDISEDRGTPEGVWSITGSMGRNQTLKGLDENGDGEPDYESHVAYWMPFVGNLVAFHDADWRSSFGGSIYMTNGSHGCVNLPVGAAAELYELTHVGEVVVAHY